MLAFRMLSKRTLPLGLLLLAICLVYANSLENSFHFDDFHTITDNPAVRSLGNLHRIVTDTSAFSVLPANRTYRPVVTASLALDYALGHGYAPFAFHLSTLLWFLVLVATLYLFCEALLDRTQVSTANRWLALGIAAWFGLHPAMAETVNYVIQRGDLYCTLGCVAVLSLYARLPRLRRFGLYLIPFVLAMLSKPPAAVFPVLLLLYVFFFEASAFPLRRRWRASLLATVPAVGLTVCLLWLQAAMTPKSFQPSILSPWEYRLTQPYVWLRYGGALFLPLHLNVDTDLQPFSRLNLRAFVGLLFVLCLMGAIAFTARRRRLYPIAYGLLWFVITQLPTSLYPLSEVENDHRLFFAFPGLMLAVVWSLFLGYTQLARVFEHSSKHQRWLRNAVFSSTLLALCGYAYGAHVRNRVWRSEASLWADDVRKSPHNGRGLMIYGLTRMNAGDNAEALALFERALRYTPNYPTLEINLGVVYGLLAAQGNPALTRTSEQHFERAIALSQNDDIPHAYYGRWLLAQDRLAESVTQLATAVALNPQREMQRDLLLTAYEQEGNTAAARQLARETLALVPGDATALAVLNGRLTESAANATDRLINASLASYRAGAFERSIAEAREALAHNPNSAEAWNNIGAGYGALAQWAPAMAAEQQALQLNPTLQIARNNLQWFQARAGSAQIDSGKAHANLASIYINDSLALYQQGRYNESVAAARRALALDASSAEAWNNIAASEAALHRWDEAIAAATKAVALNPNLQLAKNNLAWAQQGKSATVVP